jgi:hypothetical protein
MGRVGRIASWLLVAVWALLGSVRLARDARANLDWATATEAGRAASESVASTLAAMEPYRARDLQVRQLDDSVWKIRAALVLALSKQGFRPKLDGHWFYEYVPARLAWPSDTCLFLAAPRVAACALPGPGLRVVASNAACAVLFCDLSDTLARPAHSYENPFTAAAAWPYVPPPAGEACGYPLVGPALTLVFPLRPRTAYRLALEARPLVPELRGVAATLNGVPLEGDLLRQEVPVPADRAQATNTLVGRGVAPSEPRPTLSFRRLRLTVDAPEPVP